MEAARDKFHVEVKEKLPEKESEKSKSLFVLVDVHRRFEVLESQVGKFNGMRCKKGVQNLESEIGGGGGLTIRV